MHLRIILMIGGLCLTGLRLFADTELIGCLVTSIIPSKSFSKPLTSLKLLTYNEDTRQRQTEQEYVFKVKQTNKLSITRDITRPTSPTYRCRGSEVSPPSQPLHFL